jgi:hypothetical protein
VKKLNCLIISVACFLVCVVLVYSTWGETLICDPNDRATYYLIDDPWFKTPHPAELDGSIRYDITGAHGLHRIEVKACNNGGCSEPVPFCFA